MHEVSVVDTEKEHISRLEGEEEIKVIKPGIKTSTRWIWKYS